MNNLSWVIYLIGVADSARSAAIGILVICGMVTALGTILGPLILTYLNWDIDPKSLFKSARNWLGSIAVVCLIIVIIAPSRQTLLLVAGSEMGQCVAASEAVQSIVDPGVELLRTWIAEETRRLKGKKD